MGNSFDISELKKENVLTVQQAAFYAGTSRPVVERWLDSGDLGYFVLPRTSSRKRQRRIFRAELDAFLESLYQKKAIVASKQKRQPLILLERSS
jgi:excisionase family DNA binding protein